MELHPINLEGLIDIYCGPNEKLLIAEAKKVLERYQTAKESLNYKNFVGYAFLEQSEKITFSQITSSIEMANKNITIDNIDQWKRTSNKTYAENLNQTFDKLCNLMYELKPGEVVPDYTF